MIGVVPEQHPWSRIQQPSPIPSPLAVSSLQSLDQGAFTELVRDHLIPRDDTNSGRTRWQSLWRHLGSTELRQRTFDTLENLLDQVEDHLDAHPDDRRARRFHQQCNGAWERLRRPMSRPETADALTTAISDHRSAILATQGPPRPADRTLWRHLRRP